MNNNEKLTDHEIRKFMRKVNKWIDAFELEINKMDAKLANPTLSSSDRNQGHLRHDLDETEILLSQASETHRHRAKYNRERAYLHTHETSHCTACDSSLDTSSQFHIDFHQTSIERESYAQLLSQILRTALVQHGSSDLTDELFQALSLLKSTPSLECHVEQRADQTRIRFLSETHPKFVHSELILHRSFHNN